ncbi:hypothetical protein RKD30_000584 [Streptomyces pristinaespiralis]
MPCPVGDGSAGKSARAQVAPRSLERHSPSWRLPSHSVSLSRGVDDQSLAGAAAVLVGAEPDRQVGTRPGGSPVVGAQHGAVARPALGVGADGEVEPVGVVRVDGDRLDAEEVVVVPAEAVVERRPGPLAGVPAVGAADVGAGVGEALDAGVEQDTRDEAGAADDDVAPAVRLGRLRRGGEVGRRDGGALGGRGHAVQEGHGGEAGCGAGGEDGAPAGVARWQGHGWYLDP